MRSVTTILPGRRASELLPFGGLACKQEGLRVFAVATDFERTEVLVPESVRGIGTRFSPHFELVEVFRGDFAFAQPVEEVIAERRRQTAPLDFGHYSPKVRTASSSLRRVCSSTSRERAKRSASSRKRFFSCCRASIPDSMSSTMMRLALVRLVFASDFTRRATRAGSVTL